MSAETITISKAELNSILNRLEKLEAEQHSPLTTDKQHLYKTVESNVTGCLDLFTALSETIDQEKFPGIVMLLDGLCEHAEDRINIALSTLHKGLDHEE